MEICSYVLNNFAKLAPPFYLTTEDVDIELDTQRAQPLKIKDHRLNRGPGGTLNVQFEAVWKGHEMSTWEDETSMACLLYTSPSPRDLSTSRMPSSA